jgi:hypothetical protein
MKMKLAALLIALSFTASPAMAMPAMPDGAPLDPDASPIVHVVSKAYKRAAYASCRRQYGSRLTSVSFAKNGWYCHYRKSTKTLTKNAANACRKKGMRLSKVVSIKTRRNITTTSYICRY